MERFADDIDRSVYEQEKDLERRVQAALRSPRSVLAYLGKCHNCSEPVGKGHLFCDADCRDDHEARTAARRR